QHGPLQRQPAAPLRRLLRDGRLARDTQSPDQEHPVLRLSDPGESAGAGNPGSKLLAPVAAVPVRDLRDRQLPLPVGRDLQHHLLPDSGPQTVQVAVYQIVKFLRTPGRLRKVKKARTAGFAVAAVAIVTGILLIPTPLRIQGTL